MKEDLTSQKPLRGDTQNRHKNTLLVVVFTVICQSFLLIVSLPVAIIKD